MEEVYICYTNPSIPRKKQLFGFHFEIFWIIPMARRPPTAAAGQEYSHPFFSHLSLFLPKKYPEAFPLIGDQDNANVCFAFVAADLLHFDLFMNEGIQLKCSEQELMDCRHIDYPPPGGIVGSIPSTGIMNSFPNTFDYARDKGIGIDTDYKWVGVVGNCQRSDNGKRIFIQDYEWHDENSVLSKLDTQPVTAAIYAPPSFMSWKKTKVYEYTTRERQRIAANSNVYILHAITLVGYGQENGEDIYVARNSYSKNWGHKGYFKCLRKDVLALEEQFSISGTNTQDFVGGRRTTKRTAQGTARTTKRTKTTAGPSSNP